MLLSAFATSLFFHEFMFQCLRFFFILCLMVGPLYGLEQARCVGEAENGALAAGAEGRGK